MLLSCLRRCCLGSGIFILPATIVQGTGSVGISLLFWAFGGIVSLAALLVWLELGLCIPRFELNGNEVSVPRSGGEKNYVSAVCLTQSRINAKPCAA